MILGVFIFFIVISIFVLTRSLIYDTLYYDRHSTPDIVTTAVVLTDGVMCEKLHIMKELCVEMGGRCMSL